MGFLNTLFGKKEESGESKIIPWKELSAIDQVDEISENKEDKLIAIFKHSTRCGTSRMALRSFESGYDEEWTNVDLYFLDLLAYREVSNEVAMRFGVMHQSPQLILIKNGKMIHHASHYRIDVGEIGRLSSTK